MSTEAEATASGVSAEASEEASFYSEDVETGRSSEVAADAQRVLDKSLPSATVAPAHSLKTMPVRRYLDSTVVPILLNGLQEMVKERPEDACQWLAHYLLENNPKKDSSL